MNILIYLLAFALLNPAVAGPKSAAIQPAGIAVQGSGVSPHLAFACCDRGIKPMQTLFATPGIISSLVKLHAGVAVAIADFSPQRAMVVRRLNQSGVPTIAWIMLPRDQGLYLNADNASRAAARVSAFEKWTEENRLKWSAVGLDIEPDFQDLSNLKQHTWRLVTTFFRRALNINRLTIAQRTYSAIIASLQTHGYIVQTYQMPYLPAERSVHSNLLDRLLGTVEVQGNTEYLMLYTSYDRSVGAGMIWSDGNGAQGIAIGSTGGKGLPGTGSGPLNWDEFSRDLIVASHFTRQIGVYNLEGCVRQDFLRRLETMNWSQSFTIPSASVRLARTLGFLLRVTLWTLSNSLYLILAVLLLGTFAVLRWRVRTQKRRP